MDKTIEQIKRAHQGDKTARETLVKDNLGLVWSIVRRFAGRDSVYIDGTFVQHSGDSAEAFLRPEAQTEKAAL